MLFVVVYPVSTAGNSSSGLTGVRNCAMAGGGVPDDNFKWLPCDTCNSDSFCKIQFEKDYSVV